MPLAPEADPAQPHPIQRELGERSDAESSQGALHLLARSVDGVLYPPFTAGREPAQQARPTGQVRAPNAAPVTMPPFMVPPSR